MTIDKRINFRGGGMDMGNASNQAQSASMGNTSSNTSSNNNNNNNNNNNSGNDNRPTMADIAGPVTAPVTSLPSNIGFNESFSISTNPLDIMEQYRRGNLSTNIPGGPSFVTLDNPYMSQGLETNRYNNYLDAQNLRGYTPDSVNIPFMPLATKGLQFLQKFGSPKNTQFFADNVAGKYGYGYGEEDYQQYMQDRVSGKVGAYGNEEQGQNALNEGSRNLGGIESVVEVQNTGPVDYGPMEGMAYTAVEPQPGFRYIYDQYGRRSSIPIEGYTGTVNEDASINNDFNFGTQSNPIYSDDLV